jgi:DNA-binding transcriptional MocR family regulator
MVSLARQHDCLVVADEIYHFLNYTHQPPPPLAGLCGEGNVIALNSFSKILAPGLRLGWMQADASLIGRIAGCGLLDSGGGLNPFTCAIIREVIESGDLEKNINSLRKVYAQRVKHMSASLHGEIPSAQFVQPEGGYFFWVRLPGVNTADLQGKAQAHQVGIRPGMRFSSAGGLGEYMRLSVSYFDSENIREGIRRLARCLL